MRGDVVWKTRKIIVMIDGCYWHGCPTHGTSPKSNAKWWRAKIGANVERDRRHNVLLRERGWTVLRFWEHESPGLVADAIELALGAHTATERREPHQPS
jgi:DNA mismatch endonuclease (patch repair protein)